jgi:hypothetical protein
MKKALAISAAVVFALLCGCASKPLPVEELKSDAVKAAHQRGASEFGCEPVTIQILRQEIVEEPQETGWYDYPHKAAYTVDVSGCGKRTTYSVACDDRASKPCTASPVPVISAPRQLADVMRPDALKAAHQRGNTEFGCEAVTTQVLQQQTIQEPQGSGWYDPPYRAAYTVNVSGCGQRTTYLVACNERKKDRCVTGAFQEVTEHGPPQLADKLLPDAVRTAQQHGTTEFGCEAVTTQVLRQATIQEAQGTGWYDPPYRAVYSIVVSGCGKHAQYAVACNHRKRSCVAGESLNTEDE